MNTWTRLCSEAYYVILNNCENEATLQFIDRTLSWVSQHDNEASIGLTLSNTSIEAYAGVYYLSSLTIAEKDIEVHFPTLINAFCGAYALWLEEYSCFRDITNAEEEAKKEILEIVEPFLLRGFEISDRLQTFSEEWAKDNVPF